MATSLAGVDPETGRTQVPRVRRIDHRAPPASMAVRGWGGCSASIQGAQGDAWGYGVAVGRVLWTNADLPWPHYFQDLSGIGGQHQPRSPRAILLAVCAQAGGARGGPAAARSANRSRTGFALNW